MIMSSFMPPTPTKQPTTNSYVGTINYMSPERLDGDHYSFPSDIWALGVMVYELIVGQPPYPLTDKPII